MGTIGDGREGLVIFMGMTVGLAISACHGIGRVGEGEFVQGRVDAEERVVRGERTAVGDGMRVRKKCRAWEDAIAAIVGGVELYF